MGCREKRDLRLEVSQSGQGCLDQSSGRLSRFIPFSSHDERFNVCDLVFSRILVMRERSERTIEQCVLFLKD